MRLVTRASLQATEGNAILTPRDLYNWAERNILGITFFFVPQSEIQTHALTMEQRMKMASTIPGTRNNHRFVPVSTDMINMYRISANPDEESGDNGTTDSVTGKVVQKMLLDKNDLRPGAYFAAVYDGNWYIGCIIEHSDEEGDVLINFMDFNKTKQTLIWPQKWDQCHVPFIHVLCSILHGSSGRQYKIHAETVQTIINHFEVFKSSLK